MTAVLRVENLETHFGPPDRPLRAVDGVSFSVGRGEILGLVGESGSGKSVTGFSILGLVEPPGRVAGGRVLLDGENLVGASPETLRRVRGRRIAMIFQDPMMTLNPVLTIETQMVEAVLAHDAVSHADARARSRDALGLVGIPSPDERLKAYPHQFSGGMRQRVAIAIALLHRPDVIIADEPTTALDVTIQSQILYEVRKLADGFGMALIWISHDLGVVASLADRIAVMYAGRIVEEGGVDDVLDRPAHPYTRGLMDALPGSTQRGQRLRPIPGLSPAPGARPTGCAFRTRCFAARPDCEREPTVTIAGHRQWRCHHPLAEAAA
ncbi:ABC transporter ATP-binding protein [Alsobacter sp. R-9]